MRLHIIYSLTLDLDHLFCCDTLVKSTFYNAVNVDAYSTTQITCEATA